MKKLLLVTNDASASGKSTLVEILYDYFAARGMHPLLLTTEQESDPDPSLNGRGLQPWDLGSKDDLNQLIEAVDDNEIVVVDIATGDGPELCRFFEDRQFADVLPELGGELTIVIPVKMEAGDSETIVDFVETISDNADYVVSKSFSIGCENENDFWDGSYGQKVMSYLSAIEVHSPRVTDALALGLDESGFELSDALAHQGDLPQDLLTPVLRWKAKFCTQLQEEAAEYLLSEKQHALVSEAGGDFSNAVAC